MARDIEETTIQVEKLVNQNNELININSQYQQILEKTNSQLSLWNNPYGISVGILTVLVAFLTIAAAGIIFWQNRSHRKLIREELDNVIDKQRKEALKAIEIIKNEKEKELKNAAKKEQKGIKAQIDKLKNKELELKTGLPDLSQYMRKEDFLCKDCQNQKDNAYSVFGDYPYAVTLRHNINYFLVKRKCLSCGKEF